MKLINNIFPLNICSIIHLFLFCYIINIISTQNIVDNEEKYPTFKSFLSKFHKTYNLKAEYEKREQIYLRNIQQIKQSNCESCGVNFYADWTEQEIKNLRNVKQSEHKSNIAAIPKMNSRILAQGLPPFFDWRNVIGFSEVKDSGYCGASYAFSTVAFFEQLAILSGNANSSINFSEMYLMTCSLQNMGCKGGQIESTFDLVIDKGGLPIESKYPYIPSKPAATNICLQTDLFKIQNVSRMSYYNIKDPEVIKLLIGKKPVISSICGVDLAFYYPNSTNDSSRTLKCNSINKVIDHSVLIVGYTQTQWIVKNSWGKNWGIDGYAYISKNSAHDCCIGDQIHTTGQVSFICGVIYCKTCVQTYTCSRCEQGRYVAHNTTTGRQKCEICTEQNCTECYNYIGSCKWCVDGFAINATTGKCVATTIANCNRLQKGLCFQCKPGYRTSSSKASCLIYCSVNNCNKCPNGPCTECRIGFSLTNTNVNGKNTQYCVLNNCTVENCSFCDASGNVCLQCKSGYLLNSTTATCYTNCTLADCINCTLGSTTCNECVQGKSYNSTKKVCEVFAGTTNCKVHGKTCTTCRTGYTLNSTTKLCVQTCVSCLTCLQTNPNHCLSCPDDSFLKVGTYQTVCALNPCNITNCSACFENGTCITCATKFLVYNVSSNRCQNQCTLPNCRDCLPNATACSYCNPGFAVDYYNKSCVTSTIKNCPVVYTYNNSLQCWNCDTNYYLDYNTYKDCYPFCTDANCEICELQTLFICTKCNKGYYFVEQNGGRTCTKIKPIMAGCELTTFNQSYCFKCNVYYKLNPLTGSCELNTQSCPSICEYCTQSNNSMISCKCKQQGYTFQYSTQTCILNPITNNPNCTTVEVYSGIYFCMQCENKMIVASDYLNCLPLCSVNNCTQCLDGYSTSCLTCDPGFYLQTSSKCTSCLPNCRTCTSAKCLSCQPGYLLSNNGLNCTQINCPQGFFFDGISCSCPPGTYLKNSTCRPCQQINCVQCSISQCFACQEGYFIQQSDCKKCLKNCKSCDSSNECSQCKDGYILDNSTKLCVNPVDKGSSFFVSQTKVLQCPLFCLDCNNQSICTQCLPGYANINGQCISCKGTCRTCYPSNVTQCLSCFNGYYLQKTTCIKCNLTNCQNCELNALVCIKCKDGYYFKDGECVQCSTQNCLKCNFTGSCTKCSSGYTLMADGTCQQCGGNCRSCNSSAIHQCFVVCNSTSFLSNNTCISCPSECKSCISPTACSACVNGYIIRNGACKKICAQGCYQCDQQNTTKCSKCIQGYLLNANNKCDINISCNENRTCLICPLAWAVMNGTCQMCNVSQNCIQCANGNLSKCTKCKSGFFLNNTECVVCNQGCQNCSEFERCLICEDGYFLPQNVVIGNCSKCDPMCRACSDYKDKCLGCNEGYELTVTDKCLRVQKIQAQIELNLAFDSFPSVSKEIRSQIIGFTGTQFQNDSKLYIITELKQGSTILSFTLSIPDSQDPTAIYNKVKTQLTAARQVAGISLIAVKRIDLINPNAPVNNQTNNNSSTNINKNQTITNPVVGPPQTGDNKSNHTLAIILGVVIPCVVIVLGVLGYFLRKKYFQNKVDNNQSDEFEFRQVADQSINQRKANTITFDMSPVKQGKIKDLQNLNYSTKNQIYFNSTTYPQQSFQRLDRNQSSTKRDYVSQFDNNISNIIAEHNDQDQQSCRSIDNRMMINSSQQENLDGIKNIQSSVNTINKNSQNQNDELQHPQDHNRFFEIEDQSNPVTPENFNQLHTMPAPVNLNLQVIDFGEDDQNQQF